MKTISRAGEIRLAGPPWNTRAVVQLEGPSDVVVPVTLEVDGEPSIHRAYLRPLGPGTCEMRLSLPRETPPGAYRAETVIGGAGHRTVIVIEAVPRLRLDPGRTAVAVEPGGRARFTIHASNHGNVAIELPRTSVFDLDDAEGQDRALGRTLRAELAEGERRVDRFFEELRQSHGGEGRVRIVEGAGPLEPRESRALLCRVEIPMTTEPGRVFLGAWQLGPAGHILEVEVRKPSPGGGKGRTK